MVAPGLGVWFYVGWAVVVAGVVLVVVSRPRGEPGQALGARDAVRIVGDRPAAIYATGIALGFVGLGVVLLATGGAADVRLWLGLGFFVVSVAALIVIAVISKRRFVEFDHDGITISQGARYRVRWDDLEGVTIHRESIVELHVAAGVEYVIHESARVRWFRAQFGGPEVAVMTNQLEGGFPRFREEFLKALDAHEVTFDD